MNATVSPPRPHSGPALPSKRGPVAREHAPARSNADPRWVRPALITLLACTAIAYLWDLSASGYANSFYAAAVQAGTKSWKAFFFGSIDSSNFITVDKPPASLWVMSLSGRIFGFSSMSMLVPQVLEGVAAVGLLYAAVRRWFGAGAGLAAGALLAITPVAALMFRFNNPDALLVCLLVAGAYCLTRALEHARTGWVVAAGTMIGFAFLAKMAQAFLVLPAFGLVYLIAAPTGLRRRAGQLLAGAVAIVVSCGWWVAIVELWPTGSRPFIDGTSANNVLSLVVGYNGLGRIFGASGGGGGGGGANFSGSTGTLRLFNDLMGGQASWLLPPALLALVLGLWHTRRAPRTDRTRAALLLWGGWLVVTGAIFSYSSGAIHTYYTVALAPAIAALVAIGGSMAWRERAHGSARIAAAAGVLLTAGWSWVLLDRTPHWNAWLLVLIPASLVLAAICLLAARGSKGMGGRISLIAGFLAAVACLAGPVAYSAQTISSAHTGSIPSAGPSAGRNAGSGAPGSAGGGGGSGNTTVSAALRSALASESSRYRWVLAVSGSQTAAGIELATGGDPVMAIGGFNNQGGNITLAQFKQYVAAGEIHYYMASTGGAGGSGAFAGAGHTALTAGSGRQSAPGGFGGGGAPTGGAPTLRGSGGGPAGGAAGGGISAGSTSAITSWVKAHYKAVTIGGETLYDLSQPLS